MNCKAPYSYDFLNLASASRNPSTVHVANTGLAWYFKRWLLQRACSVFRFEGMPDFWPENMITYLLFAWGWFVVVDTDEYGAIPQPATLSGYNVFYQPRTAIVSNPLLPGNRELEIGTDCALVRLCPDYGSAWDIVDYYGDMMALISETMGMNVTNSKLSYAFAAGNKAGAESLKHLYDEVQSGNPAVFYDKGLTNADGTTSWEPFLGNVSANYIAGDLQILMEQMGDDFDAKIGIPNANVRKNAHILNDELHANDVSTYTTAEMWLDTVNKGLRRANELFGLNVSAEWRNKPEIGGGDEQGRNADAERSL